MHTVLRAATGEQRRAVVEALVAQRDARVVPVLVRILDESDPFGADHAIVLETLGALGAGRRRPGRAGAVGADAEEEAARAEEERARSRSRALTALRAIKTPAAAQRDRATPRKTGDRHAAQARAGGGATHG